MAGAGRRKVASQEEAERLLGEFELAGGELTAFCGARGLDGRSLHAWGLNLGRLAKPGNVRGRADEGPVRLVEVAPASRVEAAGALATARYRVVVGDLAVEVDDHFREDTLVRLLGVVLADRVRSC